ncbi:MAG: Ldh family oxidoreductase [Spirochaetales bacterium]|nr:Ldh family oxidoreductase [Spirochaetales bacterium]
MTLAMPELINFYRQILIKKGCAPDRAGDIARVQVEIHGFGVETHGLRPLHVLIDALGDTVDPEKRPLHALDAGPLHRIDASGCISMENIRLAVDIAGEAARTHGIGLCTASDTGWIGALGYHLAGLAKKGFLVMGWVQSSDFANVVPHGGKDPRFSTNPMGYSFPVPGEEPAVADFSTSAVSNGKAYQWMSEGVMAPEQLFLDKNGLPGTDPRVLKDGGAMLPTGGLHFGYKGTLLSLWIEALVAASGIRPIHAEKSGGHNAVVLALHLASMGSEHAYEGYMKELCGWVKSSRPIDSEGEVRIPGERGWAALRRARENGVVLSESYRNKISALSRLYEVPLF